MSENETEKNPKEETESDEKGSSETPALGTLLRSEREKKGLTIEQVAETTRLRRHFIEDLENEKWDNLPPPVFVRGFIRSYVKMLGLDEKRALELFESSAPVDPGPPKPLVAPPKRGKKALVFIVVLLAVLAALVYLWRGDRFFKEPSSWVKESSSLKDPKEDKGRDPSPEKSLDSTPTRIESESRKEAPEPKREPEPVGGAPVPVPGASEPIEEEGSDIISESDVPPQSERARPDDLSGEPASPESTVGEEMTTGGESETSGIGSQLVLQGDVRIRTWVRICVDDQGPKEYIFQPGSRPQWQAKEGFHVIIGNAAGIKFTFKGREFEEFGNLGQVVRLSFPEEFQPAGCGE